jgi:type I restriction enzyme, S subunit
MKWGDSTLGELAKRDGGLIQTGPFGSQLHQAEYQSEGIPVIMPKDIADGRVSVESVARVSEETANRLGRHKLKPRSIVLPRRGEVTKRAFIRNEQEGWLCGTGCLKIELNGKHLIPEFLYYFMDQGHVGQWLEQHAVGTTMLNLSAGIVAELPVHYPEPETQQRIASILSAYDDLIENNRRRMALLEQAARLLYEEWFVRLRFPGHEHTRTEHAIPEAWERKPLGELAHNLMGQSPESKFYNDTGEGLPFHQGVADFLDRFVSNRIFTTTFSRIANAGDILCSVRAPVGRLNITLDKIVIGRGLAALRSRSGNQSFLFYQLKTHFFKEDLIGTGAIFASVTKAEFENQRLITPSTNLVRAFEEVSTPIDEQLRTLFLQNQRLQSARDLLLPRLMSGEIAV